MTSFTIQCLDSIDIEVNEGDQIALRLENIDPAYVFDGVSQKTGDKFCWGIEGKSVDNADFESLTMFYESTIEADNNTTLTFKLENDQKLEGLERFYVRISE